jgi:hypothetical protein
VTRTDEPSPKLDEMPKIPDYNEEIEKPNAARMRYHRKERGGRESKVERPGGRRDAGQASTKSGVDQRGMARLR